MKISEKEYYGVTNPKVLGPNVNNMWEEELESDGRMSASVKHCGGSVLVWGCISASGVGNIVQIDAIMNAEKYRQVLIYHAIPSG